jgi:CheY-like chemotaxis protein
MADLQREAGSGHENKTITVLVVEDEAMMRAKLAEELRDAGYLVVEASDGMEAVEILTIRRDALTLTRTNPPALNSPGRSGVRLKTHRGPSIALRYHCEQPRLAAQAASTVTPTLSVGDSKPRSRAFAPLQHKDVRHLLGYSR